jgi:hypothetical protein
LEQAGNNVPIQSHSTGYIVSIWRVCELRNKARDGLKFFFVEVEVQPYASMKKKIKNRGEFFHISFVGDNHNVFNSLFSSTF